jgi:hypothetical protein
LCFSECLSLSIVTFESGSKLSCIEYHAFYGCSRLSSISIPCSVDKISKECFELCYSLATVTFESGSKLSCIENNAFRHCTLLKSIRFLP